MKVAVITPFHKTPHAWLDQCLASVANQSIPCTHFLVCDGDEPNPSAISPAVKVLRLPEPHNDVGNTARAIGSVSAISQGFDAIAYLDSDNWYDPDHIKLLCEAHQRTQAAVCTTGRTLCDPDGRLLGSCPEVDGDRFVDTNCLFLTRKAFGLVAVWYMMPRSQAEVGDRVLWQTIKQSNLKREHLKRATVNYRTRYESAYRYFGKEPPPGAKPQLQIPLSLPQIQHAGNGNKPVPASTSGVFRAQRVSLCMIVRNEEAHLEKCLNSVVDLVNEMIVVDTGSTDGTKDIAARCGAKVFDFEWVDDFSAARNESIRHATGDWILWLDGDEYFDDKNREGLRKVLGTLGDDNRAFMMKQWSVPESENRSALVVDQVRLFRKQPGSIWRHRVHEQILPSLQGTGANLTWTDLLLRHSGYQDPSLRKTKLARNLRLLQKDYEENPDEPFTLFNLGGTGIELGDLDDAVAYLQKCLEKAPPKTSYLPKVYVMLAQIQRRASNWEEAIRFCREGKKRFPKDVELHFEEGLVCLAKKDPRAARDAFEQILRLPPRPNYVGVDDGLRGHLTRYHLATAYRQLGQKADAEAQLETVIKEQSTFGPAWLGLADLRLEQHRIADVEAMIDRLRYDAGGKPIVAALRSRLCSARGDRTAARGLLEEAIAMTPRAVWLRILLSDMLIREGIDLDEAERHLNEIVTIDPKQKGARERLNHIRKKKDNGTVTSPTT